MTFITRTRLFLNKQLNNYGESPLKMLVSALVCIITFALFYYAFLPPNKHNGINVLYKEASPADSAKIKKLIIKKGTLSKSVEITDAGVIVIGYLKNNDFAITSEAIWEYKVINDFLHGIWYDFWLDYDIDDGFLSCLYFSGVTFTTLGYGDISPQGVVRFIAMMEAGLGAFLMALFVYAFTKRYALR